MFKLLRWSKRPKSAVSVILNWANRGNGAKGRRERSTVDLTANSACWQARSKINSTV